MSTKSAKRSPFCGGIFDWDNALERISELNALAEDPDLWNKPDAAQKLMRERTRLTDSIEAYRALENALEDSVGLVEMAEDEDDQEREIEVTDEEIAAFEKSHNLKVLKTSAKTGEGVDESFLEMTKALIKKNNNLSPEDRKK